jgi:IPT/TIG domain-containing protein
MRSPKSHQAASRTRRIAPSGLALVLIVPLLAAGTAAAQTQGSMYSRLATVPRGAAFLPDANGGHWWVADNQLGICELVPQNVAGQPPFIFGSCNGTPKSGGQIIVGPIAPAIAATLPAGSQFVYVANVATKSVTVVRFVFSPAGNGGLGTNTQFTITNPTFVGGGSGGGRVVGLALTAHKGLAANGGSQDLYVGYLKSGDIMRVDGIDAFPLAPSPQTVGAKVASTSDGKGIQSLLFFGNNLYIGELGGFGMSEIADPSGINRAPCSSAAPCTAISLSPNPSFLAGGMATDWVSGSTAGKAIFIGDAPLAGSQNSIKRYDPATGISTTYSLNITPSYTEPDSSGVLTNWTTYIQPLGLGYNAATGDLLVGDDPQATAAVPVLQQGHFWKVPLPAAAPIPAVTSIFPTSGTTLGGTLVTVSGTNLATYDPNTGAPTVMPTINFGANAGTGIACALAPIPLQNPPASSCTVTSPPGLGVVDVRVTLAGQTSPITVADQFTYVAPASNAIAITSIAPTSGATSGGTLVTINGQNLATYDATGVVTALPVINFGANLATNVACANTTNPPPVPPIPSTCTASSPAAAAIGSVDVQATLNAQTSPTSPSDVFTYFVPTANLFAWGITAPKGGAAFLPGALGGHWWSSDHAQGLCRQDPMSTAPAQFQVPGSTLDAINFSVCASDLVGSAGQAVYDPRLVVNLATGLATTFHYVYVPDNAVKSAAVWRLTFDPATETMVADPNGGAFATAMLPLADVRTLKPNGMALGPDGNLYVTDLVEPYVRVLTNPGGDPRTQTVQVVAETGDARGANGTQGFIGNYLYISGNRASQFFDITLCPGVGNTVPGPLTGTPCGMASIPAPTAVFVAATMTDQVNKRVYLTDSAGGGPATIYRYDASHDVYVKFPWGFYPPDAFGVVHCTLCSFGPTAASYITGGLLPAPGTANGTVTVALTGQRPWDQFFHPTTGILPGNPVPTTFAFVFGLGIDPAGNLAITEDPSAGNRSSRGTMWIVPFLP